MILYTFSLQTVKLCCMVNFFYTSPFEPPETFKIKQIKRAANKKSSGTRIDIRECDCSKNEHV